MQEASDQQKILLLLFILGQESSNSIYPHETARSQITSELIRRLAHIKNEDCGSDPKAWYRQIFEDEPDYSILLSQIAKTQNDRFNLLKEFFEPSEEERQRAAKMPTAAHKAIAQLVSRDYIRVIITTNFDHLLEKAIEDIGKSPTVVKRRQRTPLQAGGACEALPHEGGTISI